MSETKNYTKEIEILEKEIKKIDKKLFKVFFFVYDTKGTPSGSLAYIYETAYQLKELGYNVQMLYAEKDFVGVSDWLDEKYSSLPHTSTEHVDVSASDVLVIPEIYASVMAQTKELRCKRVALLQNFHYLTETIPAGATWGDLKIGDCVTTTASLEKRIKEVFPYVKTRIVRPSIPDYFTAGDAPKSLIVNIVTKNPSDTNMIVKPFFWKYPAYSWVAFREVRGLPREEAAKAFKDAAFTVWCDNETDFGYTPLEAMKAGSVVIGKIPENEPEWLTKDDVIRDNGIWFYNINDVHTILGNAIQTFLADRMPDNIYEEMKDTVAPYTSEQQVLDIQEAYVNGVFEDRKKELTTILALYKEKAEKGE